MRSLLTVASVALLASAAVAQEQPAPPQQPATAKEKTICRRDVDTGSIVSHRTCHTLSEWKRIDAQNAATADQTLSTHGGSAAGGARGS